MTDKNKKLGRWYSTYIEENIPSLEGKIIAVTGTTSGTGFYTVVTAIRKNAARVFLLNRSSPRVENSIKDLEAEIKRCGAETKLVKIDCDLASFESVRKAVAEIKEAVSGDHGIDVLINNAGIAGMPLPLTKDGYHSMMQINYFSHFLLVDLLKDELIRASESSGRPSRIVNLSSNIRMLNAFDASKYKKWTKEKEKVDLYGQSKLAMTMFSLEFNQRNDVSKVFATSADPGMTSTEIFKDKGDQKRVWQEKTVKFVLSHSGLAHSAPDGSMSIVKAAFGEDISPGDLLGPERFFGFNGKPFKHVDKGKSGWRFYKESNVLDKKTSKEMWNLTEAIIGNV